VVASSPPNCHVISDRHIWAAALTVPQVGSPVKRAGGPAMGGNTELLPPYDHGKRSGLTCLAADSPRQRRTINRISYPLTTHSNIARPAARSSFMSRALLFAKRSPQYASAFCWARSKPFGPV